MSVSRSAIEHCARGLNKLHLLLSYCMSWCMLNMLHISLAKLWQSTRKESFQLVLIVAIDDNNKKLLLLDSNYHRWNNFPPVIMEDA